MSEPDYLDSALQSEPPQANILRLLQDLSEAWQPITSETDAEDKAIGILVIAQGIQLRGTAARLEARLSVSGARWNNILRANPDKATQARGAVLTFVWDQYRERKAREDRIERPANPVPPTEDPVLVPPEQPSAGGKVESKPRTEAASPPPGPSVTLRKQSEKPKIRGKEMPRLSPPRYDVVKALLKIWPGSLNKDDLVTKSGHSDAVNILSRLRKQEKSPEWATAIEMAGERGVGYRIADE